jgi:acyl carrier protein
VGTAAPGREFAIVDSAGARLPDGEVGQIAVSSRYLSPGYWRNDEATARAYLPGPGGDERTYLTGDLGRILPDGSLHHLGRVDEMFKIRGQRVDPAEVETILLEHPGVAEAAVTAQATREGDNRLVAYIVAEADPPSTSSLRALLSGRLPPHMIPTAFVSLTELPVLRFGKVDRRSLPPAGEGRLTAEVEYVAARNSIEEAVVRLSAGLLGLERIGVNDDLFDLGLDSLIATQLVGRINQDFEVGLTVDAVFESPTAAGLAVRIGEEPASRRIDDVVSMLQELEALDEDQARSRLGSGG